MCNIYQETKMMDFKFIFSRTKFWAKVDFTDSDWFFANQIWVLQNECMSGADGHDNAFLVEENKRKREGGEIYPTTSVE